MGMTIFLGAVLALIAITISVFTITEVRAEERARDDDEQAAQLRAEWNRRHGDRKRAG